MKQFPTHIVAVYGIIENDKNEILLVKSRNHSVYGFPGGQVEVGENLLDAVRRETMEEAGVEIIVGKLNCVSSNTGTYQGYNGYGLIPTKVMLGFTCKYACGELRESDETSEVIWVDRDKVLEYLVVPNFIEKYKAYLNYNGEIQYIEYVARPKYDLKLKCFI